MHFILCFLHSQTPLPIKREDRSKKKKSSARAQAPMTVRRKGYLPERWTFISSIITSISPYGRNISYLLYLLLSNHSLLPVVFLNQFPLSKLHEYFQIPNQCMHLRGKYCAFYSTTLHCSLPPPPTKKNIYLNPPCISWKMQPLWCNIAATRTMEKVIWKRKGS